MRKKRTPPRRGRCSAATFSRNPFAARARKVTLASQKNKIIRVSKMNNFIGKLKQQFLQGLAARPVTAFVSDIATSPCFDFVLL